MAAKWISDVGGQPSRSGFEPLAVMRTVQTSSAVDYRPGRPSRVKFGQLAQDQVRRCGIELRVAEADGAFLEYTGTYPREGFDLAIVVMGSGVVDSFASAQIRSPERPEGLNIIGWDDPETDALIDRIARTADLDERADASRALQRRLADELAILVLWADTAPVAVDRRLTTSAGPIDPSSGWWDQEIETWILPAG